MSTAVAVAEKSKPAKAASAKELKAAYTAGALARSKREPNKGSAGGAGNLDELEAEFARGWISQQVSECETQNLIDLLEENGLIVDGDGQDAIDTLSREQRIAILDWLDGVPAVNPDLLDADVMQVWDAFDLKRPAFVAIEPWDSSHESRKVSVYPSVAVESPVLLEPPQAESAGDQGQDQPTPAGVTPADTTPPAPAPQADTDAMQRRLQRLEHHQRLISEANAKVSSAASEVLQWESELDEIKGSLKAAKERWERAVHEMQEVVLDSQNGQGRLPFEGGIATTPATSTATPAPASPTPSPAPVVEKIIPLSVLGSKEIKAIVGVEEFERAKNTDDPIGLSPAQLEKLESACETNTLNELEKWIAADNWWHQKIDGFGEKAVNRLTATIAAYRRVHPMPQLQDEAAEAVE